MHCILDVIVLNTHVTLNPFILKVNIINCTLLKRIRCSRTRDIAFFIPSFFPVIISHLFDTECNSFLRHTTNFFYFQRNSSFSLVTVKFSDVHICRNTVYCFYLRVTWAILLGRGTPAVPTKEAGRGRELRGTADWLVLAFRGCGKKLRLGLRG